MILTNNRLRFSSWPSKRSCYLHFNRPRNHFFRYSNYYH